MGCKSGITLFTHSIERKEIMEKRYVIGIDYGTLSGRAVLLDAIEGCELGVAEFAYPHAVMDKTIPSGKKLPEHYALQHPADYLEVLRNVIPDVLSQGGIVADDVAGLGLDFTASTLIPIDSSGLPLCFNSVYSDEPHAYVKLWKHHAAQAEADMMTMFAETRGEDWLASYGGRISSEWAWPKIWQIVRESPEIARATARFCEAGDWLSQVLTGEESHSAVFAGYKAFWRSGKGYPSDDFFTALDPRLSGFVGSKVSTNVFTVDNIAGKLSADGAALTGLCAGIPVALPMIDAHAAMPAVGAVNPGDFMMIIGTSTCHLLHTAETADIQGICGYVKDGVIPGCVTYEAGQACVGDGFAWFIDNLVPSMYTTEACLEGISMHQLLRKKAERLKIGESGLVALDWFNGNRSILNQSNLSGMLLGLTLRTRPEEIYRALLEATAYGSRMILEQFENNGLYIKEIHAAGGIACKDPFMIQIYADVLGKPIQVADTTQAGATGSAIYAAVATGIYPSIREAARQLAVPCTKQYIPNPDNKKQYDKLYQEYTILHDYFGKGENGIMKRLLHMVQEVKSEN